MFGSAILEVIAGLAFVYLVLAILCTTANEWCAGLLRWRAATLAEGVRRLLSAGERTDDLVARFYAHPLIKSLSKKDGRPSYIPSRAFALALIDVVGEGKDGETPTTRFSAGLQGLPGDLAKLLRTLASDAKAESSELASRIEQWFDDSMDRVSGWYKRKSLISTIVLAALLTLCTNADTVDVTTRLWRDPALRAVVVEQARTRVAMTPPEYTEPDSPIPSAPLEELAGEESRFAAMTEDEEAVLGQLFGWESDVALRGTGAQRQPLWSWVGHLIVKHGFGWLLTTLAVSLGAPFWFDVLKRISNVRAAGKSPAESAGRA